MDLNENRFEALGRHVAEPRRRLETFPTPSGVTRVVLESDEVTSLCPVTGQPDWERVRIEFIPGPLCLESKSLKLYFWSFRNEGHFCEALAARIAADVAAAVQPKWLKVTVFQKSRGGITITAESETGIA
ncbi:MAG: preQ(1) synthase [Deltaproteobacteria bacterium]|nr:preQ(1) synthase [Deltaproteobacteria bacterium]MBW2355583.1 preQ(1) synthase [Deltaproteobacteria bacterium]